MRSSGYGVGIMVLLVGVCLLGPVPRASAQEQPQVSGPATNEATLNAALNPAHNASAGASQPRPLTKMRMFHWGVEGGLTYAGISYDNNTINPDPRWGGVGGAYFGWGYDDDYDPDCFWCRLDYMFDVLYDTKGAKFPYLKTDEILGLKYLEILPSARFRLYSAPEWTLHAGVGPQIGFRLMEKHTVDDQTLSVTDFTKSTDFGISGMIGFNFHKKWSTCVRYTQGLTNIIDNPGTGNLNAKNHALQIYLGYQF